MCDRNRLVWLYQIDETMICNYVVKSYFLPRMSDVGLDIDSRKSKLLSKEDILIIAKKHRIKLKRNQWTYQYCKIVRCRHKIDESYLWW